MGLQLNELNIIRDVHVVGCADEGCTFICGYKGKLVKLDADGK